MKTLIFFRHAKSDWNSAFQADHDRPLAKRGVKAAKSMGRYLSEIAQTPDSIVTSSAERAQQTVTLAAEAGGWEAPVRICPAVYGATPHDLLEEIRTEPEGSDVLLLAGHEPTFSSTISLLIGGGTVRFPTAAMARIDFPADDWKEVQFGRGQLIWMAIPKVVDKILK